jgi:hypothetical protein
MRSVVISQTMYFPWIGMLEQMRLADVYLHLDDAQFSKGGVLNRVQIKTPEGSSWLTVPLAEKKLGQALNQCRLAAHDWQRKHLATLRHAYAKAPFVGEMLTLVERVITQKHDSLAALGAASMESLVEYFEVLPTDIRWSSQLETPGSGSSRVLELCQALKAERYVTGHGARNYLDHEAFETAGVQVDYLNYEKRRYQQLHGEFTPFVSALDLVANCGRAGGEVIRSEAVHWKEFVA